MRFFYETLRHKWFVLVASFETGLGLWDALTHDISKFSKSEYNDYQQHFYGDGCNEQGFRRAWLHHQNNNSHHWQFWVLRINRREYVQRMYKREIVHMYTDWFACRRAQSGTWDKTKWKPIGLYGARIHDSSKMLLDLLLKGLDFKAQENDTWVYDGH